MLHLLPNLLSLSRIVAIPFLLTCPPFYRPLIIFLASLTDAIDGYLARKLHATSTFGAIIDPIGDKLLAVACTYLFWTEERLTLIEVAVLFSREATILLFTGSLFLRNQWTAWRIQSFWCGKVFTLIQLGVFFAISLELVIPRYIFTVLLCLSVLGFLELQMRSRSLSIQTKKV
jgi:CDP-diacylglycerol--glycerol-3-phosphate 3-phosphatidyltransferase